MEAVAYLGNGSFLMDSGAHFEPLEGFSGTDPGDEAVLSSCHSFKNMLSMIELW